MFKFTIRELLLLTVIAAMGVGWWLDRRDLSRQLDEIQSGRDLRENQRAVESFLPSFKNPDGEGLN